MHWPLQQTSAPALQSKMSAQAFTGTVVVVVVVEVVEVVVVMEAAAQSNNSCSSPMTLVAVIASGANHVVRSPGLPRLKHSPRLTSGKHRLRTARASRIKLRPRSRSNQLFRRSPASFAM